MVVIGVPVLEPRYEEVGLSNYIMAHGNIM